METWSESLSQAFLPIEWFNSSSSPSSTNLLIKLLYQPEPRQLNLLATDLHGVWYESLQGLQLNRRIDDAVASSSSETQSESIGMMAGVGRDGEELAERVLEELVDGVRSARAKVIFKEEGFEQFIDISLPSETVFRFVLFKLETESAQILASHLIQPLIGTSTALLSLLRQDTPQENDLIAKLEPAIDSSGRAERLSQGKNCSTFFKVGGAGLLKRWEQSTINPNLKKSDPLQLSLPAPRPPRSPRKPPFSPKKLRTPSPESSPRNSSLSPSKRTGLASKMLDYRSKSTGEKISWDDSQSQDRSTKDKGKQREVESEEERMEVDPRQFEEKREEEEEEEPATDEEAQITSQSTSTLPLIEAAQEKDQRLPSSSPLKTSASTNRQLSLPLPTSSNTRRSSPSPRLLSPSQDNLDEKKAKKKRKAEAEEAEALEMRKAKFASLKAGPSASAKRKRGLGTRGL
ncbi:hypothetical protein JCM3765_004198 [Sporobolomyces pararoseus]